MRRLYYFTGQQFGLEAIRDRRLKLARLGELNDPFDFLGHLVVKHELRRHYKTVLKELSQEYALLCMSDTWHDPLLWGHYAHKHQGLCLGFDVKDEEWSKVDYISQRPPAEPFISGNATDDDINWLLASKFSAWSYEREYRMSLRLESLVPDPVTGMYFTSFDGGLVLKEVIVGDRSTVSRAQLTTILGNLASTVIQRKARPAFQTFEVVEQKNQRLWK